MARKVGILTDLPPLNYQGIHRRVQMIDEKIIEQYTNVIKMSGIQFHITGQCGDVYEITEREVAIIADILNKNDLCGEEKAMMIHGSVNAPLYSAITEGAKQ